MANRIKQGTCSATLGAEDWGNILLALALLAARRRRDGHENLAAGILETYNRLDSQVRENKLDETERRVMERRARAGRD